MSKPIRLTNVTVINVDAITYVTLHVKYPKRGTGVGFTHPGITIYFSDEDVIELGGVEAEKALSRLRDIGPEWRNALDGWEINV